jgi:hypothetical protein
MKWNENAKGKLCNLMEKMVARDGIGTPTAVDSM